MVASCTKSAALAAAFVLISAPAAFAQERSESSWDPRVVRTEPPPARERVGVTRVAEPERQIQNAKSESPKPLVQRVLRRDFNYGDWVAAQVFLVVCGLIAALIALALVPKTATLAVAAIDSEPARAAVVGFLGLAALGVINALNGALFGTIIWIPFGTMVALASTITFLFGGLLGVAYFGGVLQKRRRPGVRGFFSRAAVGLVAIALFNCIPGVNAASLFLQLIAFVLGLGGLIITGFGRGPDWLSQRLASAGKEWRD